MSRSVCLDALQALGELPTRIKQGAASFLFDLVQLQEARAEAFDLLLALGQFDLDGRQLPGSLLALHGQFGGLLLEAADGLFAAGDLVLQLQHFVPADLEFAVGLLPVLSGCPQFVLGGLLLPLEVFEPFSQQVRAGSLIGQSAFAMSQLLLQSLHGLRLLLHRLLECGEFRLNGLQGLLQFGRFLLSGPQLTAPRHEAGQRGASSNDPGSVAVDEFTRRGDEAAAVGGGLPQLAGRGQGIDAPGLADQASHHRPQPRVGVYERIEATDDAGEPVERGPVRQRDLVVDGDESHASDGLIVA